MKRIIIIGSGNISKTHYKSIRNLKFLSIIKKYKSREFTKLNIKDLKKFKPDFFIICSPASLHIKHLKIIEKCCSDKYILIEKPLSTKFIKSFKFKNNYFVGYNLRFHPVIIFLKKYLKNKTIFSVNVVSFSFLPFWRKINYSKSVSAKKRLGGGIVLEMSHELDYLNWIFGDLNILSSFNKKISNLKIDTDDTLVATFKTKLKEIINLNLNFFSLLPKREITVSGKDFSINCNLLKNKIFIIEKKNNKIIKRNVLYKNFSLKKTYEKQIELFLKKNHRQLVPIKESNNLMKLLNKL